MFSSWLLEAANGQRAVALGARCVRDHSCQPVILLGPSLTWTGIAPFAARETKVQEGVRPTQGSGLCCTVSVTQGRRGNPETLLAVAAWGRSPQRQVLRSAWHKVSEQHATRTFGVFTVRCSTVVQG